MLRTFLSLQLLPIHPLLLTSSLLPYPSLPDSFAASTPPRALKTALLKVPCCCRWGRSDSCGYAGGMSGTRGPSRARPPSRSGRRCAGTSLRKDLRSCSRCSTGEWPADFPSPGLGRAVSSQRRPWLQRLRGWPG